MLSLDMHMIFKNYRLHTQLDIPEGQIVGIYGKSGIGKTTLLKVVSGLHRPNKSKIILGDATWHDEEKHIFIPPQQRSVGMVFQDFALFPNLTVHENLRFAQKINDDVLKDLINTLDIKDILDSKPNNISGGQKQRVAIGRVIAYDPKVLLMDEPFAALDDEVKEIIKAFLKSYIQKNNKILIIASHDLKDLEYFDSKVIRLSEQL